MAQVPNLTYKHYVTLAAIVVVMIVQLISL